MNSPGTRKVALPPLHLLKSYVGARVLCVCLGMPGSASVRAGLYVLVCLHAYVLEC